MDFRDWWAPTLSYIKDGGGVIHFYVPPETSFKRFYIILNPQRRLNS